MIVTVLIDLAHMYISHEAKFGETVLLPKNQSFTSGKVGYVN
jgi:hypothetical protein